MSLPRKIKIHKDMFIFDYNFQHYTQHIQYNVRINDILKIL